MTGSRRSRRAEAARRQRQRAFRQLVAVLGLGIVVAVVGAIVLYRQVRPAAAPGSPIDGIPCGQETTNYHEHAHLTVLGRGRRMPMPATVGFEPSKLCFYWIHTHAGNGLLHIEAPRRFVPTLGTYFDIAGQPLSGRRVGQVDVTSGASVRAYVRGKRYSGNPRAIRLTPRADITLEIGPPFPRPKLYRFGAGF